MAAQQSKTASPFHPSCLEGKVALITGGGSGIGFEIVRQLLLHGCKGVVICGRRGRFLERACQALRKEAPLARILYQVCDVRDPIKCREVLDFVRNEFGGRLDILVNGAAGNFLSEAKALSPKGFRTVMEIDTQGTYNMTHASYDLLKSSQTGAVIINISATLHYGATWYQTHVSAAKAAIDSLTRSLALEWGSYGIRVVGIAPGPIADTPGTTKLAPGIDDENREEMVREGVPLGRLGRSWDIAMAAVYLCSEAASYVTGEVLVVDGAQWLYKPPIVPRAMVAELSRGVEARSRAQAPRLTSKL